MREDLTVKQFLERVSHMPLEEAETELVLRKEQAALDLAMLHTELHRLGEMGANKKKKTLEGVQCGRAIQVVHQDMTLIGEALREVRSKLERVTWQRAVQAVFGSEGYDKCRLWIAINTPMDPVRAEREIAYLRSKGVFL